MWCWMATTRWLASPIRLTMKVESVREATEEEAGRGSGHFFQTRVGDTSALRIAPLHDRHKQNQGMSPG